MIVVIKIRGEIDQSARTRDAFAKLKLLRRLSCVVLPEKKEIIGMVRRVENYVAYGIIKDDVLKLLVEKRGRIEGNKAVDKKKLAEFEAKIKDFKEGKIKLSELGIKDFFRLHPPRRGFKKSVKLNFPKGVLGNNKDINDLIVRMI